MIEPYISKQAWLVCIKRQTSVTRRYLSLNFMFGTRLASTPSWVISTNLTVIKHHQISLDFFENNPTSLKSQEFNIRTDGSLKKKIKKI